MLLQCTEVLTITTSRHARLTEPGEGYHRPLRPEADSKFEILKQLAFKDLGAPGRDPVYGEGLLIAPKACGPLQIAKSAPGPVGSMTAGLNPVRSLGAERLPISALNVCSGVKCRQSGAPAGCGSASMKFSPT